MVDVFEQLIDSDDFFKSALLSFAHYSISKHYPHGRKEYCDINVPEIILTKRIIAADIVERHIRCKPANTLTVRSTTGIAQASRNKKTACTIKRFSVI